MTTWGISAGPNPVSENAGHTTLTITRSSGSGSQTVYVSTVPNQGYSNGGDYATNVNSLPVTFAAGVTSQQVTLGINDLGLTSGSKTFGLLVQSINTTSTTADVLASGTFSISDNDVAAATWGISAGPNPVSENAGHTTLTITRSSGSGSQTVYVSTVPNQGYSNGGDYATNVNSLPVTFAAGVTSQQVTLGINDLGLTSGSKTFGLLVQSINTTSTTADVLASGTFSISDNDVAAATWGISAGPNPVSENAGHTTLTITRSSGSGSQTVYVSTVPNQGYSNGGDYATNVNSLPVTFAAGVTSQQVTLGINDLGLTSGSKTFGLLVQSINTTSTTADVLASGTFSISDNDVAAATWGISAGPNPVSENAGHTTLTITRSSGSGSQTVYVSTVPNQGYSNGGDYATNVNSLPVTFAAGVTSQQVTLGINDLGLTSGSKTFGLLVQSINTTSTTADVLASGTFSISDNDVAAATWGISAGPNPVSENAGHTTLTITRSSGSGSQTVYVSTVPNQGYSNGGDYATNVNSLPVTFAAGVTSQQVTLGINDLGLTSGSKTFGLLVQSINTTSTTADVLASGTFSISDNDVAAATWGISAGPNPVSENAGHTTLTITRSSGSGSQTVYVSTVPNQGYSNGGDYATNVNSLPVTFAAGVTSQQVTLGINDLGLTSGSKTFGLLVQSINTTSTTADVLASGTFSISDNDVAAATWGISAGPNPVSENAGHTTLTITRSSGSGSQTVYVSTVPNQGYSNGGDYATNVNSLPVTFAAGVTSQQVTLGINDLGLTSGSKTFGLLVQSINTTSTTADVLASGTFSISDNDVAAATWGISAGPNPVSENAGHTTLTITRSSGSGSQTVYVSTVPNQGYSNGGDYATNVNSLPVTFAAGVTSQQVTLGINDLGLTSGSKTFGLLVQSINTTSTTADVLASGTFSISDNDVAAATWGISAGPNPVSENAGHTTLTITRSSGSGSQTVYVSTVQGAKGYSANSGDYATNVNSLPVTFAAGVTSQQVTLGINDLGLTSGSKTFGLLVQSVSTSSTTANVLASNIFSINDNDSSASSTQYKVTASPTTVDDNAGTIAFTIIRSGNLPAETLYASTVNSTEGYSVNNGDYATNVNSLPVIFASGATNATVTVTLNPQTQPEPDAKFGFIVQRSPSDPISTYLAATDWIIHDVVSGPIITYGINIGTSPILESAEFSPSPCRLVTAAHTRPATVR